MKVIQRSPLIGVSIAVAFLFLLASFTNVVGVQTVKTTNHSTINDEVDQKEFLFQSIFDLTNNKEIQKIILNSEIRREGLFNPDVRFKVFTPYVLTKKYLNSAYNIGSIPTKTLSTSKIHTILQRSQMSNQGLQKEITAIIEENDTLNNEMNQLAGVHCDCEKNSTTGWNFPVLCTLLLPIEFFIWILWFFPLILFGVEPYFIYILLVISENIGLIPE